MSTAQKLFQRTLKFYLFDVAGLAVTYCFYWNLVSPVPMFFLNNISGFKLTSFIAWPALMLRQNRSLGTLLALFFSTFATLLEIKVMAIRSPYGGSEPGTTDFRFYSIGVLLIPLLVIAFLTNFGAIFLPEKAGNTVAG
jgi:hypothetical protein